MAKITVAVVGYGYWGPNLVRAFSQLECVDLRMCCDLIASKAEDIKNKYPYVNFTQDYTDIINNPDIDAVVIATPPPTHYELAKKALLANKHVFLEKPMTTDIREAEELINLANTHKKTLMIDHTLEYHPGIQKTRELVLSGEIGEIYHIDANWLALGLLQQEANVVFDLATHIFAIINYITGYVPLSVSGVGASYLRPDIEEIATIVVNYPRNIIANIHVSWLDPQKTRTLTIIGSKKTILFDLMNAEKQIQVFDQQVTIGKTITYHVGDTFSPSISKKETLIFVAEHFVDCVIKKTKPLSDGESGLDVLKILMSVNKSIKNKGVDIPLLPT